ncbi:unnamed protein product [Cylindrotheca closterium]|uniref:Uncharacterized protein n=1 Tax=Cylindrotheca closterium TaxID=2856 RepID=A0AAD2JJ00_9STRA|nr:unnamed protein product [Cylindrotheca closterium]
MMNSNNEASLASPIVRFDESASKKDKKKKKRKVKLYLGDEKTKKATNSGDVELYDILQALRVEDVIRISGPVSHMKDTIVAALYDYSVQRTKNFMRGDIFWLPPVQGVVPVEDSLYEDLCVCLDILQDSTLATLQDSPEERWDKDEMLMEYQVRIDIEMEFMKPLLIVDFSLITFVSEDAQTEFERFLNHLMVHSGAKIIKIETPSRTIDPLSGQSQSTGESTNSSSEALTEIIRFLEEEDKKERRERKVSSDRSAFSMGSSLAYSEGSTQFAANSDSGATIESGATADTGSLLAGTKLFGSLMEEPSLVGAEHRARIDDDRSFGSLEGEPSAEERYNRDDYFFQMAAAPSPSTKPTTRTVANKSRSQQSLANVAPRKPSPIDANGPTRSRSYNSQSSISSNSASTPLPSSQEPLNAIAPRKSSPIDVNHRPTRSRSYNSQSIIASNNAFTPVRSSSSLSSPNTAHRLQRTSSRTGSAQERAGGESPRRRKKRSARKREIEDEEESYFSNTTDYSSAERPSLSHLLCGLDLGDASKSLRRFFCF